MKDNVILADFDCLIDLDIAMYRFIKQSYSDSEYADDNFFSLDDERDIKERLLKRKHINPLEIMLTGLTDKQSAELYNDIMNNHLDELLEYAEPYDTLRLLCTFRELASSIDIVILCGNDAEKKYIDNLNTQIRTIVSDRKSINTNNYTILYVKYFYQLVEFDDIECMHIYMPLAGYNMDEKEKSINVDLSKVFMQSNIIHLMDLYTDIKFSW